MPRSERRRARYFLGIASIGCAGVVASGWDTVAYLYHRHSLADDSVALCEALFAEADDARGRAARDLVHARRWEKVFARDVAGKDWAAAQVVEDRSGEVLFRLERKLRADLEGDRYRIWRYLRHSRDSFQWHLHESKRVVQVGGPFLLDEEGGGRITSWGVMHGKLILGAMVRMTALDWVLLHSSTSTREADVYAFLRFSFDRDLEPNTQGVCFYTGEKGSRVPLIDLLGRDHPPSADEQIYYEVTREAGAGAGRVVVQGGAGRFRLHLDTHLGIGWHEEWGSFVYEEEELAAVAKQ